MDVITAAPPEIPAARTGSEWLRGAHLLFWVHTGTAHVDFEDGDTEHLRAGEGIWIPAPMGRRLRTDPCSVAFPLRIAIDDLLSSPVHPVRFGVTDEWQHRLIAHFARLVSVWTNSDCEHTEVRELLRAQEHEAGRFPAHADLTMELPMPSSSGARVVAEELFREPSHDLTVEEWAEVAACSPRTLRREFLRETGLSFSVWRTRCRLSIACESLAAGSGVGDAAARAGFGSRNGFTRAFSDHFGITPSELVDVGRRRTPHTQGRTALIRESAAFARSMLRTESVQAPPEAHRPFKATRSEAHTHDQHVLTWVYRGRGYLNVSGRRYERDRGDAIWTPAGAMHDGAFTDDAISFFLTSATMSQLQLDVPLQTRFGPEWDAYLLHVAVSAHSLLRPERRDENRLIDVFRDQIAAEHARKVPMPVDPRARIIARRILGRMRDEPHEPIEREVREAFRQETGMSLARWRRAARMRIARDLIANGAKPSAVAAQIGYAHLTSFSRAFTRYHGQSPREYRARHGENLREV